MINSWLILYGKRMGKKQQNTQSRKKPQRRSTARRSKVAKRKAYFTYFLFTLFVIGFLVGFGYYLGLKSAGQSHSGASAARLAKIFKQIKPQEEKQIKYDEGGFGLEGMIEKLQKRKAEREKQKHSQKVRTVLQKGKRPKLVIIIDDISQPWQIKAIQALPYHITPSIFPPSAQAKYSYKLAYGLEHFMIHLPMQSGNAKMNRMQGTLKVTDSEKKMKARAKEIRQLFPKGLYINNHTGSVFTSNYKAMKKMYGSLKREGFVFVDSRTAGSTKVQRIAKEFGDRYIVRDIFIDNTQSLSYIRKQLSKSVRIAQKRGFAIVIGHPHRVTFKALASAKNLLKNVDVVYMDELYR